MTKKSLVAVALLALSARAFAHDFWIEKKDGAFHVASGHATAWEAYDPARVKEVHAFGANGGEVAAKVLRSKDGVAVKAEKGIAAVTVFLDNQFWVKSTDGWKNITRREALKQNLQLVETGESYKYGKYIEAWSDRFLKPLGTRMEVVPLANPLALKAGDTLAVQVLLDGKPVASAEVSTSGGHAATGKTDKDGIAKVAVVGPGRNLVSVSTRVPYANNPDADQLYVKATLAFVTGR